MWKQFEVFDEWCALRYREKGTDTRDNYEFPPEVRVRWPNGIEEKLTVVKKKYRYSYSDMGHHYDEIGERQMLSTSHRGVEILIPMDKVQICIEPNIHRIQLIYSRLYAKIIDGLRICPVDLDDLEQTRKDLIQKGYSLIKTMHETHADFSIFSMEKLKFSVTIETWHREE